MKDANKSWEILKENFKLSPSVEKLSNFLEKRVKIREKKKRELQEEKFLKELHVETFGPKCQI